MSEYISKRLRATVERRARHWCEYCLCPLSATTEFFVIEHIFPRTRGGLTTPDNLALACSGCNGHKYDKIEGIDSVSASIVPLYHPRQDTWREHFAWEEDYTHLIGLSPTGRATIAALHLNRNGVINLRFLLLLAGLHPPPDTESGI